MFNNWFDRNTKILTISKKYKAYGTQIQTHVYKINWGLGDAQGKSTYYANMKTRVQIPSTHM